MTREDVLALLGPIEDRLILEVLATGATRQELVEAQAWLANDDAPMSEGRALAAGRVGQLIELVESAEEEPFDE